ncbi:hypothetical protein EG329_009290 [Mollisiaceae sp. DMI_Dod_QoI]|nr:hypothetical protein EG329_009290 [Helotiales sp. DMI_Dod_QoI]
MTSNNEAPTRDLASILKTLASLTPQNQQPQTEFTGYQPHPPPQPHIEQVPAQSWQRQESTSHIARSTTPPGLPKNHVDPATIIDWSAGLRCVMKVVAKNDDILQEVRRMIKSQNDNEQQWFKGREALIERQKKRQEGQKKLDEVLRAVGGTVPVGGSNTIPEELARELETYDMKVYRAQMQMTREMSNNLRNLGVPFFGTRSDLVRPAGREGTASSADGSKDGKVMIDEAELVKLQRRMLTILEDLCND